MDPESVRSQRFLLVRRGYDPEAVQEFLEDVASALEELRSRPHDDADPEGGAVFDARREVDEARTRAATHRLRAQRDVEALERSGRQRRARLLAEIEELAAARDQLSTDLDRAVDVVDRVVQWVRRTDPATTAGQATPGAVPGATPSVAPTPPTTPDPDVGPDVVEVDSGGAGGEDEPQDPPGEVEDLLAEEVIEDGTVPGADAVGASPDPTPDPTPDEPDMPDEHVDQPGGDPSEEPDLPGAAPDPAPPTNASFEAMADALPDVEAVTVSEGPGVVAVREAVRGVQDEVLANLRDRPRGDVTDWLPTAARLAALDDAATDAAGAAFLAGWDLASDPDAPGGGDDGEDDDPTRGRGDDGAVARDALEEARGAGDLPGLDLSADLRVALEASLARGREASEVEVALRERVAEVHRDLRQTRLAEAIEGVLAAARHHGELARWRADGVTAVAWVVGQEQRCPGRRCRGNADDGVVAPGASFAFGDVVPPAHPGCTCTLRPVGRDEAPT